MLLRCSEMEPVAGDLAMQYPGKERAGRVLVGVYHFLEQQGMHHRRIGPQKMVTGVNMYTPKW